jgi:hypothetical protein
MQRCQKKNGSQKNVERLFNILYGNVRKQYGGRSKRTFNFCFGLMAITNTTLERGTEILYNILRNFDVLTEKFKLVRTCRFATGNFIINMFSLF